MLLPRMAHPSQVELERWKVKRGPTLLSLLFKEEASLFQSVKQRLGMDVSKILTSPLFLTS